MRKALLFFLKVGLLVAAAVWIARRPGTVQIEWQGWLIETSVGVLALGALMIAILAAVLYSLWRFLLGSPGAFGRYRQSARRERGYLALTQGMVAVAAGDREAARKFARKADVLLNEPPLTLLLSAQAAQLNGDEQAARKYFEAMLERPETEFLGLRGLLTQALKAGDGRRAAELAQRAQALQPKAQWPALTLLELEAKEGHWTDAEDALEKAVKAKAIPAAEAPRHRAALLAERARMAAALGRTEEALTLAQKAHDLNPGLIPAAALLATLRARTGNAKAARRAVENAWRIQPHADLADAWGEAGGEADSLARVKRFEALVALDPGSVEGHLALARAAIVAKLWGEAANHLRIARDMAPTARVHRLLAELSRAEHGDGAEAREWLAKVAGAAPDPAWTCARCGAEHALWSASCHRCGGFDTLSWGRGATLPATSAAPAIAPPAAAAAGTLAPALGTDIASR